LRQLSALAMACSLSIAPGPAAPQPDARPPAPADARSFGPVLEGVLRLRPVLIKTDGADHESIAIDPATLRAAFPAWWPAAPVGDAPRATDREPLAALAIAALQELATARRDLTFRPTGPAGPSGPDTKSPLSEDQFRRLEEAARGASSQQADLLRRVDRVTSRVDDMERERRNDRLAGDADDLRRRLDQLDAALRELADLRNRLEDARRENNDLRRDQSDLQRRVAALEARGR